MPPLLRRAVALPLVVLLPLAGCTTWRAHGAPTADAPGELPDPVRVTRTDGSRVTLHGAAVRGDSIVGDVRADGTEVRTAVAVDDVERIDARRVDAVRTGLLIAGVAVAVGWVVWLQVAADAGIGGFGGIGY